MFPYDRNAGPYPSNEIVAKEYLWVTVNELIKRISVSNTCACRP